MSINPIKICRNCGSRNIYSRKYCGYCGAKLDSGGYQGYGRPGFNLIEFFRGLSTRKLLFGVVGIIVVVLVAIIIWQFSPKADTQGPKIYNITVDSVTASSVRIIWYTDEASSSQVDYGRTYNYGQISPMWPQDDPTTSGSTGVTTHYVIIKALSQNTTYYFRVKSKDVRGNESKSTEIKSFKTGETLPFNLPDSD
jgi:hypothetical protein